MSLLAPFESGTFDATHHDVARCDHEGRRSQGSGRADDACSRPAADVPETVDFLVHALLCDTETDPSAIPTVEAMVDESVLTWSPSICAASRAELVDRLLDSDDAIIDVAVEIAHRCVVGATVFIEWSVRGRFANVAFLDDDLLVEPSGKQVTAVGMMVMSFARGRAVNIQCHYDPVAVARQALNR